MKTLAAWVVGIVVAIALMMLASLLGDTIGVPMILQFDEEIIIEHQLYEEEKSSTFTTFGLAISIICIMLASRLGMAIFTTSWHGGNNWKDEISFITWLMGLSIYAVAGILLFLASRGIHNSLANFLFNALDLLLLASIVWGMKKWQDKRLFSR